MNMDDLYELMKETLRIMGVSFGEMNQVTVTLSPADNTIVFTHVGANVATTRRIKLEPGT